MSSVACFARLGKKDLLSLLESPTNDDPEADARHLADNQVRHGDEERRQTAPSHVAALNVGVGRAVEVKSYTGIPHKALREKWAEATFDELRSRNQSSTAWEVLGIRSNARESMSRQAVPECRNERTQMRSSVIPSLCRSTTPCATEANVESHSPFLFGDLRPSDDSFQAVLTGICQAISSWSAFAVASDARNFVQLMDVFDMASFECDINSSASTAPLSGETVRMKLGK